MPVLWRNQILDVHGAQLFRRVIGHPAPGLVHMTKSSVMLDDVNPKDRAAKNRFIAGITECQLTLCHLANLNFIAQQCVTPFQIGQKEQG